MTESPSLNKHSFAWGSKAIFWAAIVLASTKSWSSATALLADSFGMSLCQMQYETINHYSSALCQTCVQMVRLQLKYVLQYNKLNNITQGSFHVRSPKRHAILAPHPSDLNYMFSIFGKVPTPIITSVSIRSGKSWLLSVHFLLYPYILKN